MARAFHVVALQPGMAEWVLITGRDADRGGSTRFNPPAESEGAQRLLGAFDHLRDSEEWGPAPFVLILPVGAVSFRRLEFPFSETRKVVQAIPFMLENELLGDLADLVYDYEIIAQPEGGAQVFVSLASQSLVGSLLQRCRDHNLTPIKVTYSALVLFLSQPPASTRHYQVYVGPEEAFVSHSKDHHLHTVKAFSSELAEIMRMPADANGMTATELTRVLFDPSAAGQADTAALGERVGDELGALCTKFNQFIRTHSLEQHFTLSLHGLLAVGLRWDGERRQLIRREPGEIEVNTAPRRFFGLLEEVGTDPEPFTSSREINFIKGGTGLLSRFAEFRRLLMVAASLLAVLLGLFSTDYLLQTAALRAQSRQLDGEIRTLLKSSLRGRVPASPTTAVQVLKERVNKLRQEASYSAKFFRYDYDMLNLISGFSNLYQEFPDLTLESLTISKERITFSGVTTSYNASESLKNRLSTVPGLKGSAPTITHQRNRQTIRYAIKLER